MVLAGILVGATNAVAIVGFGANALAATLGMLTVLLGLQYVICGGDGLITSLVPGLYSFSNRQLGPVPLVFVFASLLLVGVALYVVAFTRVGRHSTERLEGTRWRAAGPGSTSSGFRVAVLVLSAVGASLGGLLYMGQQSGASNVLGADLAFQVYAALMIGGYSIIRGGRGQPRWWCARAPRHRRGDRNNQCEGDQYLLHRRHPRDLVDYCRLCRPPTRG